MKTLGRLGLATALLACLAADRTARPWLNPGTESQARLRAPSPAKGFTAAILGDRTGGKEAGRQRKYYSLTHKGRRELARRAEEWRLFNQAGSACLWGA